MGKHTNDPNVLEIRRKIQNLNQIASRLKMKNKNPELYKQKQQAKHKKYWNNITAKRKREIIERNSKRNKANRKACRSYTRKFYKKNSKVILAKLKAIRDKKRKVRIKELKEEMRIAEKDLDVITSPTEAREQEKYIDQIYRRIKNNMRWEK